MKLTFRYNRTQDIDCILEYGRSSANSPNQTKVYESLTSLYGKNPSESTTSQFIDIYLKENKVDIENTITTYQKKWNEMGGEYHKRAKNIFGINLPTSDITAYITINNRCPYNINDHYFFVSVSGPHIIKTTMHELWHFYTWYKYGVEWEEKLGGNKYNELKEALTVLLNAECKDLLPEGIQDNGYPQHKELRERILKLWSQEKDMDLLWKKLTT